MRYKDPKDFEFSKEHAPYWNNNTLKKIDLGCGARPVPNCDAYVDLYPDSPIERQNRVTPDWCKDRLTICDIEKMPFKDKEFDFAYARSVLEHTNNPGKACDEIIRIAKAGYITGPSPRNELIVGWTYHKWFMWVERNKLLFLNKKKNYEKYLERFDNTDINITILEWKDKFKYKIL